MKAISLWQPWASLFIAGAKLYETRHWALPEAVRGERVAIHAARTTAYMHLGETEPFFSRIIEAVQAAQLVAVDDDLPRGALLGTLVFDACSPTEEVVNELARTRPDELHFGDFTPGRFAWRATARRPFRQPTPFRGRQRFFNVPDSVLSLPTLPAKGVLQ